MSSAQEIHNKNYLFEMNRIKNKLSDNKKREALYLRGNPIHRGVPQGSFNTMTGAYGSSLGSSSSVYGSGITTRAGTEWIKTKLQERATQLKQIQAVESGQMGALPPLQQNDSVNTSLEIFFNEIIASSYSDERGIKNTEIYKAIGNIREYGLTLSRDTLNRYSDILQETLNGYITTLKLGMAEATKADTDNRSSASSEIGDFDMDEKGEVFSLEKIYIGLLSNINNLSMLYKLFLCIIALIETYDLSPSDRQMAFTNSFRDIIKAKPIKMFPKQYADVVAMAQNKINDLKEILPKSWWQNLDNNKRVADMLKDAKPEAFDVRNESNKQKDIFDEQQKIKRQQEEAEKEARAENKRMEQLQENAEREMMSMQDQDTLETEQQKTIRNIMEFLNDDDEYKEIFNALKRGDISADESRERVDDRIEEVKAILKEQTTEPKKRGRPKGSKNKPKDADAGAAAGPTTRSQTSGKGKISCVIRNVKCKK